ncbi:hypothetical protein PYCC9005_003880 [Savitreella phatthalungensis]
MAPQPVIRVSTELQDGSNEGVRLVRFHNGVYTTLGKVSFTLMLKDYHRQGQMLEVTVVEADVVQDLKPDLFIGRNDLVGDMFLP